MPAHPTMLHPVPSGLPDEAAILADPFAVALHSVTRHPPATGAKVLVYGAGSLGTMTQAILRTLYPDTEVAVIARFDAQAAMAESLGAALVLRPEDRLGIIEDLARWSGGQLVTGTAGLPMCHPGGIDTVYDTVGKPETLEVGVRVLRARGTLVKTGFHGPGRWEWSPLYFKEISWVGSNAFGVEEIEGCASTASTTTSSLAAAGPARPSTHAHPHLPARTMAGSAGHHRHPGRDGRHQGRHRPPLSRRRRRQTDPVAQGVQPIDDAVRLR